jgi:hypothetical protein
MARRHLATKSTMNNHEYDDQYLFRLVSTFGWEDAISFCDGLVLELEDARANCRRIRDLARQRCDVDRDDDAGGGLADETDDDDGDHLDDDDDDEDDYDKDYCDEDNCDDDYDGGSMGEVGCDCADDRDANFVSHDDDIAPQRRRRRPRRKFLAARLRYRQRRRRFLGARRRLHEKVRIARDQLYYRDQWRNTPLHAASYVKPPLNVVMGLFRLGRTLRNMGGDCDDKCDDDDWWMMGGGECDDLDAPIWATTSGDDSTPFLGE